MNILADPDRVSLYLCDCYVASPRKVGWRVIREGVLSIGDQW